MKLELVVHCYRYSRCLTYQLSSLILYPPKDVEVLVTVFCDSDDEPTRDVLHYFLRRMSFGTTVPKMWTLPKNQLLRRAIGRNMAAKQTTADVVWFTDADWCFYDGCIDAMEKVNWNDAPLWFVPNPWNTTKEKGDEYALRASTPGVYRVAKEDYFQGRYRKAIGGMQICPGDVAREIGYVPDCPQSHLPARGDNFLKNKADVRFRKVIAEKYGTHVSGKPVDLPSLIRIRQTEFGRVDTLKASDVES